MKVTDREIAEGEAVDAYENDEDLLLVWLCSFRNMLWTDILGFDEDTIRKNVDSASFRPSHKCVEVHTLVRSPIPRRNIMIPS